MDTVTLAFTPEADEHVAADRLYDRTTRWWTADRVVAVVLALVGTAATLAVGPRWWTLVWFPLAVLEWFHLVSVRPFLIRRWFRANPKFQGPYELVFSDEGIRFRSGTIDSKLAWSTYQRVLEDGRMWLLVYGPRMYTVLPKRAFTPESEAAFRALLTRHLPGKDR